MIAFLHRDTFQFQIFIASDVNEMLCQISVHQNFICLPPAIRATEHCERIYASSKYALQAVLRKAFEILRAKFDL
jgi:hypothetical protein